jgi:putative transposase
MPLQRQGMKRFAASAPCRRRTFRYRLYPTPRQANLLNAQLEECRWLYNHFLEGRKTAYEQTGKSPGLYEQQKELPGLKEARPSLAHVHSQVLQNVAVRIDRAFQAFFRRVQAGAKPGYPRFRGRGRYDSLTFPQVPSGCEFRDGFLRLSKVGAVPVVLHRQLEGLPKTCTIKRSSTGKRYACFCCEVQAPKPLGKSQEQVGIDVGLHSFVTLSTGKAIDNPRFFRADEKELAKAQRKLAKETKGRPSVPSGARRWRASTNASASGGWTSPTSKPARSSIGSASSRSRTWK